MSSWLSVRRLWSFRSNPRSRPIRRSAPLLVEVLEDRRLLTTGTSVPGFVDPGDLHVVDRGDYYVYDESRVGLSTNANQVAVRVRGDAFQAIARLTAAGAPLDGYRVTLELDPATRILTGRPEQDAATVLSALQANTDVVWASPVLRPEINPTEWSVPTNEVIVSLKSSVTPAQFFTGDTRFSGYRPLLGNPDAFVATVASGGGLAALQLANQLDADPRLSWASPNFFHSFRRAAVSNDSLVNQQWHLNNTGQNGGLPDADADVFEAWGVTTGASNIVISVVDDGIQSTHPDLVNNMFVNAAEASVNAIPNFDDDSNGWKDDIFGYDFAGDLGDRDGDGNPDGDPNPSPSHPNDAHGTAVAGVIAAQGNNNLGVAGVAHSATLIAARIFNGGVATTSAKIAEAIIYAAGLKPDGVTVWKDVHIMNNSWGGGAPDTAITAAFVRAQFYARGGRGVVNFIASGNSYSDTTISYPAQLAGTTVSGSLINLPNDPVTGMPPSITLSGIIAVGASNDLDERSNYSNAGPQLDFLAPSNPDPIVPVPSDGYFGIVTTDRTGTNGYNPTSGVGGDYTNTQASAFGGTSSATPLAAGIAALILSLDPTLTATQVRGLMRNTTDLIGPFPYYNEAEVGGLAGVDDDGDGQTDNFQFGFNTKYGYGRVNANNAVRAFTIDPNTQVVSRRPEIQLLDDRLDIADGFGVNSRVTITADVGRVTQKTLRIRNQGTAPLNLGTITIDPGPFRLVSGFTDTVLDIGESALFVVEYNPTGSLPVERVVTIVNNDADENTFDFVLKGVGSQISGAVYEDWNGNGSRDVNDPGVAGVTVYLDTNDNNILDSPTFSSSNVPRPIPDQLFEPGQATSTLTVSNIPANQRIENLDVRLNIQHTAVGNLLVQLTSPQGTTINLITNRGGFSDNYSNTILDDQASLAIADITPLQAPFTNRFRPETPLATFNGENPNGVWTLKVLDTAFFNTGTIAAWSLILGEVSTITIADNPNTTVDEGGRFAFNNLAAGNFIVRRVVPGGFVGRGVDRRPVNLASADSSIPDQNFGHYMAGAIYGVSFFDHDGDRVRDANAQGFTDEGLPGRTVFIDANDNRVLDEPTTQPTGQIDLAIPDSPAPGLTNDLNVTLPGQVIDLDVQLYITHPAVSNLQVRLTAIRPTGNVTIPLILNRGGSGANFGTATQDMVLDDEAPQSITTATATNAPFTATSFRAERDLAGFRGVIAAGVWRLEVIDTSAGNTGILVRWGLSIRTAPTETKTQTTAIPEASRGNYRLGPLPAGVYRVREILPANVIRTLPQNDASYVVVLTAGQTVIDRNFGSLVTAPLVVQTPAAPVPNVDSPTFGLAGTAEPGSVINVFFDEDGDGQLDTNENTSLATGTTLPSGDWLVSVPLRQNQVNRFLVTATIGTLASAAVVVPPITEVLPGVTPGGTTVGPSAPVASLSFRPFAVLTSLGSDVQVRLFDTQANVERQKFSVSTADFPGGLLGVAVGDVTGDQVAEVILVGRAARSRPNGRNRARNTNLVRVQERSSATGAIIRQFLVAVRGSLDTLTVTTRDVTGDAIADVVLATLVGRQTVVRMFNGLTLAEVGGRFLAVPNAAAVALGDINGDGQLDVIAARKLKRGGRFVTVFDGVSGAPILTFFPLGPRAQTPFLLSTGDRNGDGRTDIVVSTATSVLVFDGVTLGRLDPIPNLGPGIRGNIYVGG